MRSSPQSQLIQHIVQNRIGRPPRKKRFRKQKMQTAFDSRYGIYQTEQSHCRSLVYEEYVDPFSVIDPEAPETTKEMKVGERKTVYNSDSVKDMVDVLNMYPATTVQLLCRWNRNCIKRRKSNRYSNQLQ